MRRVIKNTMMMGLAAGVLATPLATAISCASTESIDLTKTIVVLSPDKKDADGNISNPMDPVWDSAWKKFQEANPEQAKKYSLKKLHVSNDIYEKLSTMGMTSSAMPDIWYFPSDKDYMLHDQNNAIMEIDDDLKSKIATEANITKLKVMTENVTNTDGSKKPIGIRYKKEDVLNWFNLEAATKIYPKFSDFAQVLSGDVSAKKYSVTNHVVGAGLSLAKAYNMPGPLKTKVESIDASGTTQSFFDNLRENIGTFEERHQVVAQFMASELDVAKIGGLLEGEKAENSSVKNLMSVDGVNGWFSNAMIYSIGNPNKGGLIWPKSGTKGDNTRPLSIFQFVNKYPAVKRALNTWLQIAKYGPKAHVHDGASSDQYFNTGAQAFSINGTWGQKDYSENLIKVYKKTNPTATDKTAKKHVRANLFAIPLAKNSGLQMRHYEQGWSFGLNRRNESKPTKLEATKNLMAQLFDPEVQKIYYDNVENYVPANLNSTKSKAMSGSDQYISSALSLIQDNHDTFTVDRGAVSSIYFAYKNNSVLGFDKRYGEILAQTKQDKSGNISAKNISDWGTKAEQYLQTQGFVDPSTADLSDIYGSAQ